MVKFYASGKKSNLMDFTVIGELMLVAVAVGFLVYMVLGNFSTTIDQANMTTSNYTEFIETSSSRTTTTLDWAVLAFTLAALAFSIIMARRVPTEPLYIAIVLFICFVFFIISMVISNVFGAMMDNGQISAFINNSMPITKLLLIKFPYVTAIYEAIVLIVFFNKNENKV